MNSLALAIVLAFSKYVSGNKCDQAVSYSTAYNNDFCMNLCDTHGGNYADVQEFQDGRCAIQHYELQDNYTGKLIVDECFNQWIYGYSQPKERAAMDGAYHYAATPASCQLKCQQSAGCVNWFWVSELGTLSDGSEYNCELKNTQQVTTTIQTSFTQIYFPNSVDPNIDPNYCNVAMDYQCLEPGHYTCLKCSGTERCVWKSDAHVAGYKFCRQSVDPCNPLCGETTTTTCRPTTTTTTCRPTTTTTTCRPTTTTTTCRPTTTTTTGAPQPPRPCECDCMRRCRLGDSVCIFECGRQCHCGGRL